MNKPIWEELPLTKKLLIAESAYCTYNKKEVSVDLWLSIKDLKKDPKYEVKELYNAKRE